MGTEPTTSPQLELFDHQEQIEVPLEYLRECAAKALPLCLAAEGPEERHLPNLPLVEINFVDDAEIARVHLEFMDLPDATDVITFAHGEIVISTETAQSYAAEFGNSTERELALYIIHGLLHLNGHEDATVEEAAEMKRIQERILASITEV